ncbi:MAG: calcium/sodium antiporter [Lachnospiraceae bacterium]|nr:calcium/sodium antiporter [Lachnospiraceae bacterium]
MDILIQCALLVLGFVMLVKGADWFVDGAAGVAERFGIPQLVIGLTIVAMGTSSPEAAVSIAAALKGSADITIGNIVGSNILNIFIILGLTATIVSVAVAKSTIMIEIPYMILVTAVLLVFGYTGKQISLVEGFVFLGMFVVFLIYLFKMSKEDKDDTENAESADVKESADKKENADTKKVAKKKPMWQLLFLTIIGLVLIVWGSDVAVDAATVIAKKIGLTERFIGLTIVALGTSLLELFTSVSAAMKGKADIAIGNIVGSNIFNILFVVGTTALITPVAFQKNFIIDTSIAIAAGILLWLCVFRKKKLTRAGGITMLLCYVGYFIYLLV